MLNKNTNDNIYYNVTISNIENIDNYSSQQIQFSSTRNESILDDPSKYYCSIVRFSINGGELPILNFPIQSGQSQTNVNLGLASVTLKYQGSESQQYLIYIPSSNFPSPPPPSSNPPYYNQFDSPYYYIYEYQKYADIINNAFTSAFNAIPHPPNVPGKPICSAPYIIYNIEEQKFGIVALRDYYDELLPNANRIDIYFNLILINDFQGFDTLWNYNTVSQNGKDVKIIIKNNNNNMYFPPDETPTVPSNYLINKQQFNAITAMNIFNSIIISSSTLPVNSEYISLKNNSGTNYLFKTLTDFQPLLRSSGEFKGQFQYVPNIYRLLDMNSTSPLTYIDLQVFWSDKYGNIRPLFQQYGSACNIKILFVKKYLYQNYHPKTLSN